MDSKELRKHKPTEVQERIEQMLTNGLGYDSRTDFGSCDNQKLIILDNLHDSSVGLGVHLTDMSQRTNPGKSLGQIAEDHARRVAELSYTKIFEKLVELGLNKGDRSYRLVKNYKIQDNFKGPDGRTITS